MFVKPNNGGSSIGMSKVNSPSEELGAAIEKAFKEDDQVLGRRIYKRKGIYNWCLSVKGEIIALPITEIISKKDFFDYEAKYLGASQEITPAAISDEIAEKIREQATKIYRIFNCKG